MLLIIDQEDLGDKVCTRSLRATMSNEVTRM